MARKAVRRTGRYAKRNVAYLRLKKLARRLKKKTYRKGSRRALTHPLRVKGMRSKLKKGTEIKQTFGTFLVDQTLPGNAAATIFAFNSIKTLPNTYYWTPPGNNVAGDGYIGAEFNSLYFQLSFSIVVDSASVVASGYYSRRYRLLMLTTRRPYTLYTTGIGTFTLPAVPNGINAPIDTRDWIVQYDKTISIGSGLIAGTQQSFQSLPRQFKFNIPARATLKLQGYTDSAGNPQNRFVFNKETIFYILTECDWIRIIDCRYRFYYKDP